jgi:hypothetical protein
LQRALDLRRLRSKVALRRRAECGRRHVVPVPAKSLGGQQQFSILTLGRGFDRCCAGQFSVQVGVYQRLQHGGIGQGKLGSAGPRHVVQTETPDK